MKTEQYLKTEKVYKARLANLKDKVVSEEGRLKNIQETESRKIVPIRKTIEILTEDRDALQEDITTLKEDKSKKEKENKGLEISIESNKKDLESYIEKRESAEKGAVDKEKEIKNIESDIAKIQKENDVEKDKLEKLTKKRISAGEEKEILANVREEIKRAYERAGMKYPYA